MSKTKRSIPRGPARLVVALVAAAGLVASGQPAQPAEAPSRALPTSVAVPTQEPAAPSVQVAPRVQLSARMHVSAPRRHVSAPRITRTEYVRYAATVSTMQTLLDRCDGSVAIRFSVMAVRLLAEHDYCGGRWVLHLDPGDVIRVVGGGIRGIYRVNRNIKVVPTGSSAYVLRGMGDVVAQTCRADGDTLRLVGLTKLR